MTKAVNQELIDRRAMYMGIHLGRRPRRVSSDAGHRSSPRFGRRSWGSLAWQPIVPFGARGASPVAHPRS
eukprot:2084495-Alexandrium_andersonii.AAC.1